MQNLSESSTKKWHKYAKQIACSECGKVRWMYPYSLKQRKTKLCVTCSNKHIDRKMEKHPNWKGGVSSSYGYIVIKIPLDSPYYPMTGGRGQIREHRLVMARHLGRCLRTNEIVHHLNGIRDDNRIENLVLTKRKQHEHNTLQRHLKQRIRQLEKELAQLR